MDWQKLIGVLSEEKAVYTELIELAELKRDAVYKRELEQLDATVRREQGAVLRLGHWEKQRLSCMEGLTDPPSSPTLLFFADTAPPAEAEALRALHGELSGLIAKLQKLNNENKALIQSRLDYVRFALDTLNSEQDMGMYGAGGTAPSGGGAPVRKIIDKKV